MVIEGGMVHWLTMYTNKEALFRMQHILRYGARLAKERKKDENNSDFRLFQVCHFKIVTARYYYYTADWGKLSKLLYVLLDASMAPVMISR